MAKHSWPAWRYGPGGQAQIFHSPEEVPEGWEDHPQKVTGSEDKESLMREARELGIVVPPKSKPETIRRKIEEARNAG